MLYRNWYWISSQHIKDWKHASKWFHWLLDNGMHSDHALPRLPLDSSKYHWLPTWRDMISCAQMWMTAPNARLKRVLGSHASTSTWLMYKDKWVWQTAEHITVAFATNLVFGIESIFRFWQDRLHKDAFNEGEGVSNLLLDCSMCHWHVNWL